MIALAAQIEPVTPVRAPAVDAEPLRQATDGARADVSAQATREARQTPINVAQPAKEPRPAPVANDHEIRLTVNSDTHEVIATLIDLETNEVIREIPSEDMRRGAEVMRAIIGQIIDKVA
jgi:uncharacterized FlaG/YvyC family protein